MSLSGDDDDNPLLSSSQQSEESNNNNVNGMPPFPMSQPRTLREQQENEEAWRLYDQQQQQHIMQQAILMNTMPYHQQSLPPSIPPAVMIPPGRALQSIPQQQQQQQQQQQSSAKKAGKKSKEKEPRKRQKKSQEELPPELQAFRYEHNKLLICEEEVNDKAKDQSGPVSAARYIITRKGKPNEKKWDLKELSSGQIRKLALNFGCTRVGSLPMFDVRVQMALRKRRTVVLCTEIIWCQTLIHLPMRKNLTLSCAS